MVEPASDEWQAPEPVTVDDIEELASKMASDENPQEHANLTTVIQRLKDCSKWASHQFYVRRLSAKVKGGQATYAAMRMTESTPMDVPKAAYYFALRDNVVGSSILFRLRAGAVMTNDKVSKFDKADRGPQCYSCSSQGSENAEGSVETATHFLNCPKYVDLRSTWAVEWESNGVERSICELIKEGRFTFGSVDVESTRRSMQALSLSTNALPGLGDKAISFELVVHLNRVRAKALSQMWDLRRVLLSSNHRPESAPVDESGASSNEEGSGDLLDGEESGNDGTNAGNCMVEQPNNPELGGSGGGVV
jgi:hypothetical protein